MAKKQQDEKTKKPSKKAPSSTRSSSKKNDPATAKSDPPQDPVPAAKPQRLPNGQFAKGHDRTGGIQQGQKQHRSLRVQNAVLAMVGDEVETQRFKDGLQHLFYDDPKGYYQVITGLMRFCAPTLQSQSLEIQETQLTRTIDDKLDQLMNSINK